MLCKTGPMAFRFLFAGFAAVMMSASADRAAAQDWFEAPTELGPNSLVTERVPAPWYIQTVPGMEVFTAELEAIDAIALFRAGAPDTDPGRPADVIVGIFDTFEQAEVSYRFWGLEPFAAALQRNAPTPENRVSLTSWTHPTHETYMLTFQRLGAEAEHVDRCIARLVIDMVYNGFQDTTIAVGDCAQRLANAQ